MNLQNINIKTLSTLFEQAGYAKANADYFPSSRQGFYTKVKVILWFIVVQFINRSGNGWIK